MHLAVKAALWLVLLIATLLPLTLWVLARAKREEERIERIIASAEDKST
jgi:hypothetical protein